MNLSIKSEAVLFLGWKKTSFYCF